MDTLRADLSVPLRAFAVELALEVGAETLALVGPSGAGKTSVLRAIAGLVRPSRGLVVLGGETWFDGRLDLPPERRRVGLVFQEFALFPHLTVRQNVAFGGRQRRRLDGAAQERRFRLGRNRSGENRADSLLERLGIARLASARPGELSGGERQRVALARALAREPGVLLLDEPLGALDPHTRGQVRAELREHLRDAGLPTLLVTHDYADAAALADRVGVLVEGRLVQVGTPAELLAAPASAFVAEFTGVNLLVGRARPGPGGLTEVALADGTRVRSADELDGRVGVVVYPWDVAIAREVPDDSAQNHVRARISAIVPLGNRARVTLGPLTAEVTAASAERLGLRTGDTVVASFKATTARLTPLS
jgi:molybdopterin-binding protein